MLPAADMRKPGADVAIAIDVAIAVAVAVAATERRSEPPAYGHKVVGPLITARNHSCRFKNWLQHSPRIRKVEVTLNRLHHVLAFQVHTLESHSPFRNSTPSVVLHDKGDKAG